MHTDRPPNPTSSRSEPVVRSDGVTVERVGGHVPRRPAPQGFAGLDLPATLAGALTAVGVLIVLGGLLAAAGSFGYQATGASTADDTVAAGGLVAGFVTLVVAFLAGGWVAGRMARYDGGLNGLVAGLWFLLATAGFAALGGWAGTRYDVFDDVELPAWFSSDATVPGIVSAAVGIAIVLLAAWAGGRLGQRFHGRADNALTGFRSRSITGDRPATAGQITGQGRVTMADRISTAPADAGPAGGRQR
jgi:hypothetical protein